MKKAFVIWISEPNKFVVVGILALICIVLVTYFPALNTGLYLDDWHFLETVGRKTLPEFLEIFFDPRVQVLWYRPLQGVLGRVEYALLSSNFFGYHLFQVFLHLANCFLLFAIVRRLTQEWRLALLSAIVYAGLPVYSLAVIWISVVDPLVELFYLSSIWIWLVYLQGGPQLSRVLAYGAFVLLLLTKETGVTLPFVLILIDRLLIRRTAEVKELVLEYSPFVIIMLPYLLVEWSIQTRGWYSSSVGYGPGLQVIQNLVQYFGILAFPWTTDALWNYVFLAVAILLLIWFTVSSRTAVLTVLVLFALVTILPVAGFGRTAFHPRYLYLPSIAMAVALALLCEWGLSKPARQKWRSTVASILAAFALFVGGLGVSDASTTFAELSRQERVPFRDISQRHPTFPADSYLYFIIPHSLLSGNLSGKFFLRYGRDVNVETTNTEQPARLRDHNMSYVYYFDETGRTIEVSVEKNAPTQISLPLPVQFSETIRLEGYEVVNTRVKRGEALVVLLYWRASEKVYRDYTVFAHLVDSRGEVVAGYDSQPKQGTAPTSGWLPNQLFVDSVIMPVTSDVPAGTGYRLELGLYYLPTMQRAEIVDTADTVITDRLAIQPFTVVE